MLEAVLALLGLVVGAALAAVVMRSRGGSVEALRSEGAAAPLPLARRDGGNRKLHQYNVSLLG